VPIPSLLTFASVARLVLSVSVSVSMSMCMTLWLRYALSPVDQQLLSSVGQTVGKRKHNFTARTCARARLRLIQSQQHGCLVHQHRPEEPVILSHEGGSWQIAGDTGHGPAAVSVDIPIKALHTQGGRAPASSSRDIPSTGPALVSRGHGNLGASCRRPPPAQGPSEAL